jgi:phosphomannomutase
LSHRVLTSFKAYDIRGRIGVDIDEDVAYRVGRAVAQHLRAKSIVVGYDARSTSAEYAAAVARGVCDAGADVLAIGMAGTEEMYWAVTEFGACGGIEITASHNPIDYNGMKIVKSGSRPLDDASDFQAIRALAEGAVWSHALSLGRAIDRSQGAREKYVSRVLSLVDVKALHPLKLVVNSGNGAAGPTFDAIASRLAEVGAPLEFVRVHHSPDPTFPNGIPNPLLPENHAVTSDVVKEVGADFGVAFDGDFDRCFLFDGEGKFVPGEYVVGLLAEAFLAKEPGGKVVHDPRVIWNTLDVVSSAGGTAIQSKTGHAFIKEAMRANEAVYGGEMSAHHYFRDFAYCDSGMLPWLLIAELVSKSGRSLTDLLASRRAAFPSSGEVNFRVKDAYAAIAAVRAAYAVGAEVDEMDGLSLSHAGWRLNVRKSNTEPLVRLNVEARGDAINLSQMVPEVARFIQVLETNSGNTHIAFSSARHAK